MHHLATKFFRLSLDVATALFYLASQYRWHIVASIIFHANNVNEKFFLCLHAVSHCLDKSFQTVLTLPPTVAKLVPSGGAIESSLGDLMHSKLPS
ncbi:Uncharacterised protein [Yersinia intermedia]|jgi:hypothetical protein|nr:Uncharacterised protein [Yersinia intermedia]CNC70601.1 Uncharacterised protein [Yersinia intermedia]CNG33492.1 Uncharacterised protein [Yersinia intermedia]CNI71831.1 Uncharacterised protein [Yersinia intermedia]CRE95548.1 Uncharacterised protein [Yersinia intermedia]